jgi:ABC-type glycerol-3-phosphate transport system permease component
MYSLVPANVPPTLIPHPFVWSNYQLIFGNMLFLRWILNSMVYAVGATALNVLFSAMAGYALGRMKFPGKNFIFTFTLAVMMIPSAITLIPKFLVVNNFHYFAVFLSLYELQQRVR